MVLKSEGIVKKHQADVLGVYRMVDSYNDRPVYKQDGGENYIYYRYFEILTHFGSVLITFLLFKFCKQYLVCGDSCGSPVWLAQELNRERQQQEVKKDLYILTNLARKT